MGKLMATFNRLEEGQRMDVDERRAELGLGLMAAGDGGTRSEGEKGRGA